MPPNPLPVTFRRNLRSRSPSHLSSVISSSLPSPTYFSSLDVNAAIDCNYYNYYKSTSPPEVWDLLVSDASPEHSRSPFLAGGMICPPPSGMLDPCQSSSNNWKLISFNTTWLHHKKSPPLFLYLHLSLYLSLLPLLACIYFNNT